MADDDYSGTTRVARVIMYVAIGGIIGQGCYIVGVLIARLL